MTIISTQGWAKWLNDHPTRDVYDKNPDKVMVLCGGPLSMPSRFKKLTENKNLVLLSRAPLGKKCQTMFNHSVVDLPMIDDEVHFVALANMKFVT